MIILEISEGDTHKHNWEEDGSFALERLLDFGRECVPSLGGLFVALTCRFQHTEPLSNMLEKEANPVLEVIYGGDLK